ncbi:hypothetical protein [Pseudomonas vanderleydeniana]|uniref:Uncharacterized protein n=1 Tax=Pseudomonas vanderleydeniana TaxID=2745495 RepID=A0A9E6PRH5_9PSED|nr:hypothetical protein [Pseudomonas vanderleydeniana]QXI31127.1 hypothetical protein HU752_014820 [Pseudomonas vanderleydeniana]
MDVLKKERVGEEVYFDIRFSEGEFMVYADCLRVLIEEFSDVDVVAVTGGETKLELLGLYDDLVGLLRGMERLEYLPDRFRS